MTANNVFITQHFDWNGFGPRWARYINGILKALTIRSRLVAPQTTGATTSLEQRINMYHLLSQVLAFDVPGQVVEVGVDRGSSAALFQTVLKNESPSRQLHLYDLFPSGQQKELNHTFAKLQLTQPNIHVGWIQDTLPAQLPGQISFAHLDLGPSDSTDNLRRSMTYALESVYPRLSSRGICLIADYCEPQIYRSQGFTFPNCVVSDQYWNVFPVVKETVDSFLAGKPEAIFVPFSGEYSHAFFRKV
jgi:O-methyltransferase